MIINLPPQHGKSNQVTIRYPVWRLEREPNLRVGVAAYSQFLANKFSRAARRIARERIEIASDRAAVEEWETAEGGVYRAVGRGGGISGQPFDLFVIDDLVKGRREAESAAVAEEIKDWYAEEVYPRAKSILYIGTRWGGLADPVSQWLESDKLGQGEKWEVINLPALAEENDPLGRAEGQTLCPDLKPQEFVEKAKDVLGLNFYAVFQGQPQPRGGKMFRIEMFRPVDRTPAIFDALIRYWDKAGSISDAAAFTAGVLMGITEGLFWILDVVHGKWEEWLRDKTIKDTADRDKQAYGGRVQTWIEQEPGYTGEESVRHTIRRLAGHDAHAERVTGDKVERAREYASQCQAGNVRMKIAPWNKGYVEEHTLFPTWKWKDRVDASSGAFNKLAEYSEGALI